MGWQDTEAGFINLFPFRLYRRKVDGHIERWRKSVGKSAHLSGGDSFSSNEVLGPLELYIPLPVPTGLVLALTWHFWNGDSFPDSSGGGWG